MARRSSGNDFFGMILLVGVLYCLAALAVWVISSLTAWVGVEEHFGSVFVGFCLLTVGGFVAASIGGVEVAIYKFAKSEDDKKQKT